MAASWGWRARSSCPAVEPTSSSSRRALSVAARRSGTPAGSARRSRIHFRGRASCSQGLRAAFSPDGPLAIRPGLDPSYLRWLWAFRRNCTRETWLRGVRAFVVLGRPTLGVLDGYRAAGVEFEMHSAGLLLVGIEPKKVASYTEIFRDLASVGFEGGLRELSAGDARELEPALSDRIGGGVLAEIDRVVQPLLAHGGARDLGGRERRRGPRGCRGAVRDRQSRRDVGGRDRRRRGRRLRRRRLRPAAPPARRAGRRSCPPGATA